MASSPFVFPSPDKRRGDACDHDRSKDGKRDADEIAVAAMNLFGR